MAVHTAKKTGGEKLFLCECLWLPTRVNLGMHVHRIHLGEERVLEISSQQKLNQWRARDPQPNDPIPTKQKRLSVMATTYRALASFAKT